VISVVCVTTNGLIKPSQWQKQKGLNIFTSNDISNIDENSVVNGLPIVINTWGGPFLQATHAGYNVCLLPTFVIVS